MTGTNFKTLTSFIRNDRHYSLLLFAAAGVAILEFLVFKHFFPHPNFFPDSYSYLSSAFKNSPINLWPIGYSKFLRAFSCFTHSDTLLTLFQYLSLQISTLYLTFTVAYLFRPGRALITLLTILLMLNPLALYTSNFVSSDALFAALSLVWVTQILWLIRSPNLPLSITHCIVLLILFTFRFTGGFYVLISLAVVALSSLQIWQKIGVCGLMVLLIGSFTLRTIYLYKEDTGVATYSPFAGWQLAGNALYAYAHVQDLPAQKMPRELQPLQTLVIQHMDSLAKLKKRPDAQLGIYYQWDQKSPLKVYLRERFKQDSITPDLRKWAQVAPLYKEYGKYIIENYPQAYFKYFLSKNALNYLEPDPEFLGKYNMERDTVDPIARYWFSYETNKIYPDGKSLKIGFMKYFAEINALLTIMYLLSTSLYFISGTQRKKNRSTNRMIYWVTAIWVINSLFSIAASPIVLRYLLFPSIICITFSLLIIKFILSHDKKFALA